MSDKDWFESMPSPFDKPAATVHGTGSGEARCPKCGGARNKPLLLWTRTTGWGDVECGPVCTDDFHKERVPTPPASPMVTLQRWSFVTDDRTGSPVAFPNPNGQWVKYDDALELLRAAEKK